MKMLVPYQKEKKSGRCICKSCSSYNECMGEREQELFCAVGKSHCTIERKGCNCSGCPIYVEYNLNMNYWCSPTSCVI